MLLFEKLTERKGKIDRKRKEADSGQAPTGGSPDERSRKGTKGPDAAADSGRCFGRKVLSRCGKNELGGVKRGITREIHMTEVGASWGNRGAPFFYY